MSTFELSSTIFLWLGFFTLLGVNLILMRQIGILYERVAPAGALSTASRLNVGMSPPAHKIVSLSGQNIQIPNKEHLDHTGGTFVLFSSPDCPVCKKITPIVMSVLHRHIKIDLVIASAGGNLEKHVAYIKNNKLTRETYVVSDELPLSWGISKLPYGVLLNARGEIAAFGLINTREHVESLFEAYRLNVPSLQAFLSNPPAGAADKIHVVKTKDNGAFHG